MMAAVVITLNVTDSDVDFVVGHLMLYRCPSSKLSPHNPLLPGFSLGVADMGVKFPPPIPPRYLGGKRGGEATS